jgi:hypothetical protein
MLVMGTHESCPVCRNRLIKIVDVAATRNVFTSDRDNSIFSIYLILPAAICPGVYSASNINEH